ncbi:hypothetical protein [Streptomyces sp. NBC_00344]|uniref:hypothetical protein n=1 Tax=Streptomyces sp. NBC_00344 TaxID=2975720 RepID=UPI002E23BF2E
MPFNPVESGSVRPSAVWNEAVREFVRTRRGAPLTAHERVEYQRLCAGYTRAVRDEASAGPPPCATPGGGL